MKIATLANKAAPAAKTKPAGGGKAQPRKNKGGSGKATVAAKAKNKAAAKPAAARPGVSPKTVALITKNAAAAERARLAAAGRLVEANKGGKKTTKAKGKKKAKNGTGGGLLAKIQRNPNLRDVVGTVKAGGIGLLGGGAAKITAAIMLAVLDRFLPSWSSSRFASPVATFLAAVIVVPVVVGLKMFGLRQESINAAVAGGVLFSVGELFAVVTGRDALFSDTAANVRTQTRDLLPNTTAAPPAGNGQNMGRRPSPAARAAASAAVNRPLHFSPAPRPAAVAGGRWI